MIRNVSLARNGNFANLRNCAIIEMPTTEVIFFKESDGTVPVIEFLKALPARIKQRADHRFDLLEQLGHELRRPYADYLENGIYELRFRINHVQYRFLYFFSGKNIVVVSHGLTKESTIPRLDIEVALKRKILFEMNPEKHSFEKKE